MKLGTSVLFRKEANKVVINLRGGFGGILGYPCSSTYHLRETTKQRRLSRKKPSRS